MSGILHSLGKVISDTGAVVNCVDYRVDGSLDFFFAGQLPRLNSLSLVSGDAQRQLSVQLLRQVPTSWAHLCVFDVNQFSEECWHEGFEEAIRQTVDNGFILICAADKDQRKLVEVAQSFSRSWGSYGASFGIEKSNFANLYVAWFQRNHQYLLRSGQGGSDGSAVLENQLSMTRKLVCSMRHEYATLRSRIASELNQASDESQVLQRLENELSTKLEENSALSSLADELRLTLDQRESSLRDVVSYLHNAEENLARVEREKISLQQDLDRLTKSFLQSQNSLHQIIESRFWKFTAFPRKLLDRIKGQWMHDQQEAHAQMVMDALAESEVHKAEDSPVVNETAPDLHENWIPSDPVTQSQHPGFSVAEWTGTFLNLDDHSTRSAPRRGERCLFIDWRLPEPDKDSGSFRINQILSIVAGQASGIDFIGDAETSEQCYVDQLIDLGINVIVGRDAAIQHLRKFGVRYHSVFVSRPEMASFYIPLVRCYAPMAKLIYDTVDLHYVRFGRGAELCQNDPHESRRLQLLSKCYQVGELYMSSCADSVVVVTEAEKNLLSDYIDPSRIEVVPNIHAVELSRDCPDFSERKGLLFVGGFDHAPNVDAVLYFCKEIMPLLRQRLTDVTLHVVGSNMPSQIKELEDIDIDPVGYVSDLEPYFHSVRLFIAPLRYGAGLKGKVGQSMSYGLPVIGTTIAFEGFHAEHRKHGMIADSAQSFADSLVEAYTNQALWSQLSSQSKQLVHDNFSPHAISSSLTSLIRERGNLQ